MHFIYIQWILRILSSAATLLPFFRHPVNEPVNALSLRRASIFPFLNSWPFIFGSYFFLFSFLKEKYSCVKMIRNTKLFCVVFPASEYGFWFTRSQVIWVYIYMHVHIQITESSRLEKTLKVIQSNYQFGLPSSIAKSCPLGPCSHLLNTPRNGNSTSSLGSLLNLLKSWAVRRKNFVQTTSNTLLKSTTLSSSSKPVILP